MRWAVMVREGGSSGKDIGIGDHWIIRMRLRGG
jgi:hypothetical protein